jgi:predicted RNase H-like HicB family nuclease
MTSQWMLRVDSRELPAVVWREGKFHVALCTELDVASQGKSVEEALRNLKEAVELFLEE